MNKGPPRGRPAIAHSYVSMSIGHVVVDARIIFFVEDSRVRSAVGVATHLLCILVPVRI